jgi:hypothetical protein
MKKLIIIIAAALLAVGGTVGTVVGVNNSPKVVAMNAVANALEDLTKRDEVAPIFNAMNGGSLAFSAKGTDIEELMDLDDGAELSGKLYMNADKKALMLDNLSFEMGDFSLTGQFYAGSDAVYISNKEILDGTLGVERGSLVKDLKRSVLAPTSDSAYAMDEESYKILKEVFDALDNEVDQDLEKDLKKVTERYVKQAWKLVGEYAEFEAENDDVRINGDRQKARIITVTLDDKAACMIVEEMIEYLLDDDALADLVKEYGDRLENILKSTMGIEDPSKKYDDLMDELDDNMDEIIDSVKEGMQDDLVITIVTPPATADLLMLTVEYGQTEIFQAEFGHEGVRKTDCITVNVADVEVVYQVTENSRKSFEAKLAVNDSDLAKIEIDRSRDDFELELVDLCILEGDWSSKGKTTSITVDTVKVGEERYNHLKLELVLSESDKMPAREKNVDSILTVDEKDVERWEEKINEMLGIKDQLSGTYFYDTGRKEYSMEFMGSDVVIQIADDYSGVTTYYCTYEITTDRYGDPIMTITDTNTILGECPLAGNQSYEEGKGYFILAGARFEKK